MVRGKYLYKDQFQRWENEGKLFKLSWSDQILPVPLLPGMSQVWAWWTKAEDLFNNTNYQELWLIAFWTYMQI